MRVLAPIALFIAVYAVGVVVFWTSLVQPQAQAWAVPLAVAWAVVASKIVAIGLAFRKERAKC